MTFGPLKIGGVELKNNLVLAPMAGITDAPFRLLCLEGGAGLVCAEMVSAEALKHGSSKTGKMLEIDPRERPVSMQIFGSTPESIALAAQKAEAAGADIIDINAGCPVKKINKSGAGCVLIKEEKKLGQMVAAAVKAVKVPVTLKTRIGLRPSEFKGDVLARLAEENGAAAVTMHARWACDMHSGEAQMDFLARAAQAAKNIPVIGNGGVADRTSALEMIEAGCKGVMIGRAAVGNPYIFKDIIENKPSVLDGKKRALIFLNLIKENILFYGPRTGVMRSRKTAGYWLNNFEGASAVRVAFLQMTEISDIEKLLKSI